MGKLINKTQGFTIIASNIFRDENLSIRDRGLLCTLLSLPDNWEFSIIGLTKILPDGKDTIRASLQKLEKLGYLKRVQAKDSAGKFTGYDYQLSETPLSEKPSSENPTTGKPTTENPTQYNIKESNINKSNMNHSFCEDLLKEQICYEMIEGNEIAKDIFKIIVDVYTSQKSSFIIQNRKVAAKELRSKIDNLDYNDILRIAEAIESTDKKIKNIKAYVISCLYNEEYISNIYWANEFKNHPLRV